MPTYEYECGKCKKTFEMFQNMSASPIKKCPKCKGPVRRLIGSGSGIILKGSGFYETDYKKKSPAKINACPAKAGQAACSSCDKLSAK